MKEKTKDEYKREIIDFDNHLQSKHYKSVGKFEKLSLFKQRRQ